MPATRMGTGITAGGAVRPGSAPPRRHDRRADPNPGAGPGAGAGAGAVNSSRSSGRAPCVTGGRVSAGCTACVAGGRVRLDAQHACRWTAALALQAAERTVSCSCDDSAAASAAASTGLRLRRPMARAPRATTAAAGGAQRPVTVAIRTANGVDAHRWPRRTAAAGGKRDPKSAGCAAWRRHAGTRARSARVRRLAAHLLLRLAAAASVPPAGERLRSSTCRTRCGAFAAAAAGGWDKRTVRGRTKRALFRHGYATRESGAPPAPPPQPPPHLVPPSPARLHDRRAARLAPPSKRCRLARCNEPPRACPRPCREARFLATRRARSRGARQRDAQNAGPSCAVSLSNVSMRP